MDPAAQDRDVWSTHHDPEQQNPLVFSEIGHIGRSSALVRPILSPAIVV